MKIKAYILQTELQPKLNEIEALWPADQAGCAGG